MLLHSLNLNQSSKNLPSNSSNSSDWNYEISVGVVFKNLFANMIAISQVVQDEDIKPFDTDLLAQQLDLQWEKHFK